VIWLLWIPVVLGVLALVGWASERLLRNPWGTVEGGLLKLAGNAYVFGFHGLRARGREHMPRERHPGPLIVIANHTAGIDPLLIQAVCPFPIRWVMAEDMRTPMVNWFLDWAGVIFVDRADPEIAGLREAVRHVRSGGVLGFFPEGGLERPPRAIRPFQPGIGLVLRRTRAPILPVVIEGTPTGATAWSSLARPSRSRVRFLEVLEPDRFSGGPEEIAVALREFFLDQTGWVRNESPGPPPGEEGGRGRVDASAARGSAQA